MKSNALKPSAGPRLDSLGEDRLIALLTRGLPNSPEVQVGVGDDCAVIGKRLAARWTLLKTDAVIEEVHFTKSEEYSRVGWKAVCRAVSDVAAMGGWPEQALVTLALSPHMAVADAQAFFRGARRACRRFGAVIVGGETSRSPGPFFCSITLVGSVERRRCILRSGGKPGDAIYVTGRLGGAVSSGRHLDFTPRLAEGRWLGEHFKIHAMMDLSDGLAADLPRLARASGCGYEIWEDRVPCTARCTLAQARGDGEDFELLFALHPGRCSSLDAAWKKKFPRLPLTRIGTLQKARSTKRPPRSVRGFDHFA